MIQPLAYIATIVLAKKDRSVFEHAVKLIADPSTLTILSPGKAFEYMVSDPAISPPSQSPDLRDIQTRLGAKLSAADINADICVQPNENRRKSLLICDMDSTLIGQECIDELADFAGVKHRVSAITEKAMRGEIDFDGALKARVALLEGLDISVLERCFQERIALNPGARTLCQTMKQAGAKTAIVSGGFTFFTDKVKSACGFDIDHANVLLEAEGKLSGTVQLPILGRQAKKKALATHSKDRGGPQNAVAIGDGANDLAMIEAAGLGIAYYAKPAVARAAHCAIQFTDLTTALFFQGFKETEFKT